MTQEYIDINILDRVLDEINELKEFKRLYELQKKDKQRISDELYELMLYRYNNTPYTERLAEYKKDSCSCCRYEDYCEIEIPENILAPARSEKAWIPPTKGCGEFQWD